MKPVSPEELAERLAKKGRKVSPLGHLIRILEVGESVEIDTTVDEIKSPLSCYAIARSVGRKVGLNKTSEVSWILTRTA